MGFKKFFFYLIGRDGFNFFQASNVNLIFVFS